MGLTNQLTRELKTMKKFDAQFINARFGSGAWWFVDADNGSDGWDGKSWDHPLLTMTVALDRAASHDVIFLQGSLIETVATPTSAVKNFITIVGVGRSEASVGVDDECFWTAAAEDVPALTVNGVGYKLINLRFGAGTTAASVKAIMTTTGNTYSTGIIIDTCYFYGQWDGMYGIDLAGAPSEFEIRNCIFTAHSATGGRGITCSSTSHAIPYEGVIENCIFRENESHIVMPANSCIIRNNVFQGAGHIQAVTSKLVLTGGNDNIVCGNIFGGDYSNTGGYTAGTGDTWIGNWSDDVAEAEVEAVSGATSTVPAA